MQVITKNQIQADEFAYRYLETNGSGGFISQSVTGANTRNDDSLYTISLKAPIKRYKLVQKFDETLYVDDVKYDLTSQQFVNDKNNKSSKHYILKFSNDLYPQITYQLQSVTITKSIVFSNETNQVAIKYAVNNPFNSMLRFEFTPQISGHLLGTYKPEQNYDYQVMTDNDIVTYKSETELDVFIKSTANYKQSEVKYIGDYYYAHDTRDGRDGIGSSCSYGYFEIDTNKSEEIIEFIISSQNKFEMTANQLFDDEITRKQSIIDNANCSSDFATSLALATDNYLVDRDSTGEKTIIAGYPFFGDWGRDTFWAFNGVCLQTNRFAEAKSILRSFIKYEKNGLIPNMFPEADEYPFYNSVDAPLLFINSVYEYFTYTSDEQFIIETKSTIENMINSYINGTDYHIYMDRDGLICSGAELEQLTWMDVRFDTILPTPRQGKCVEINSMWYNALMIILELENELDIKFEIDKDVSKLSELVLSSFKSSFITDKGYLLDLISNTHVDNQIRSNAIWAITQNFSPLSLDEMKQVIKIASKHLYTSLGIRTLSPDDSEFKPVYGDSHFERDMAYHQGTVWPFILGGYVRAYLKSEAYSAEAKANAKLMLAGSEGALSEYCLGQISEVLDGLNPSYSKGCYGQAWSIAEIYRALNEVEE